MGEASKSIQLQNFITRWDLGNSPNRDTNNQYPCHSSPCGGRTRWIKRANWLASSMQALLIDQVRGRRKQTYLLYLVYALILVSGEAIQDCTVNQSWCWNNNFQMCLSVYCIPSEWFYITKTSSKISPFPWTELRPFQKTTPIRISVILHI